MTRRVLVAAAHPDDEILGMGGTIARHVNAGDEVTVVWVSDGSSTQYPDQPEMIDRKYAEAEAALKVLGVQNSIRGGLPDMRLDTVPHVEVNRVIAAAAERTEAEILYCVYPDVNRDHRAVFESAAVVARPTPGSSIRRFLAYATPSSVEWTPTPQAPFVPTWFVDIAATLDQKVRAFACYGTELRDWPHPRSLRAIKTAAESWGSVAGSVAAEPFVLIREIER